MKLVRKVQGTEPVIVAIPALREFQDDLRVQPLSSALTRIDYP